jgi:hypothetical protein
LDRRKYFARTKYQRPASGRFSVRQSMNASNKSLGDGMPEICMVESNRSMFSNLSSVEGGTMAGLESKSSKDGDRLTPPPPPNNRAVAVPDIANVFESRRSLMSGLSRISDTDGNTSIFSDLSRKIGNVSTRSLAMSEISNMDDVDSIGGRSGDQGEVNSMACDSQDF